MNTSKQHRVVASTIQKSDRQLCVDWKAGDEQFGNGVRSFSPEFGRTSATTTWAPVQPTLVMEKALRDRQHLAVIVCLLCVGMSD